MWLNLFLLLTTLTVLCNGDKETSCAFNSGWCRWYSNAKNKCEWKINSSKYNDNEGYLYLEGANGCFSSFSRKFGWFDDSYTNYLTIEYYVVGPGPFSLNVSHDSSEPDWSCSIQPGIEKRTAHVSVSGSATYIYIKGKVDKGSKIIITQIWNSLQDSKEQHVCPLLSTTPKPATRPTTKTTTPTTTRHMTMTTTTPTTTRHMTMTTTTRTPTKTRPTTTTTTTPTTTRPMTTKTPPTTIRPTTMATTIIQINKTSAATSSQTTTRFKTPKWNSTINISKSTKAIRTTPKEKSGDQTTETVSPSTLRNTRTSSILNVATLQSTFTRGLSSTTARTSKNNASSVVHFVSTHSSTWTPSVINMITGTGSSPESTTRNLRMGESDAEIEKEKTKKMIIGGVVGGLAFIILISVVIIIIIRKRGN